MLARVGAGGMGVVYKALDRQRNARVALKTLRTFTAETILRFKNEFRALQDLQHPNLVSLHELISEDGLWFFTMELVDGVDFLSYVRPVPGYDRGASSEDFLVAEGSGLEIDQPTIEPLEGRKIYEAMAGAASRPALDETRLRAAMAQLARGLAALHAAGKVHRDIKPSNILVTREGRVVLLDFGLATEVGGNPGSEVNVVGTADYMAPEQAASQPAGPAADWYSVGVLLFEALTGRVPHVGAPLEVLINKQKTLPPAARTLAPEAPRDLDALCSELLRVDPETRPRAVDVLRRLGAEDPSSEIRLVTSSPTSSAPFIGRRDELGALQEAFDSSQKGAPVTVFVEGESGVGKSALVRHFAERLRAADPNVVILTGRCYERESVPYKALDGIIDSLARYMARLPTGIAASLLPLRVNLLAQVFPVLRRVEAVAEAPMRQPPVPAPGSPGNMDPHELRARVFAALRDLLARLGERQPLALVIDDLQWADADSLALLGEVLHPPDAPQLLLVATLRLSSDSTPAGALSSVTGSITGAVRHVQVTRLPPAEARELVRVLMKRGSSEELTETDARAIAEEADGHPLFIDELVRHSIHPSGDTNPGGHLHLEEALWSRIRRLHPAARGLLELVAVTGGPLLASAAARAVTGEWGEPAELQRQIAQLRVANLIRSSGARGAEAIEAYHDRVRTAVLLNLDASQTRELHQRLALALEADGHSDPETLCTHWRGAGDPVRASLHAAEAARKAAAALAFDRAARLYRLSLQLSPSAAGSSDGIERHQRLGEALVSLGRSGEAAISYLTAAKLAHGSDALELQRRAAEQLLVSGHIDEGLAGLRMALRSVGLKLADTPGQALRSILVQRALLRLRGLGYQERDESQIPRDQLRRTDVCWSAAIGLGMVDTIRGADFQTRHLRLALAAGEPYRIARALAMEGAFVAAAGPKNRPRAEALLAAADKLALRIGHPHALGLAGLSRGVMHGLYGEWRLAIQHLSQALEILRERCTGVTWEVNTAHQFILLSLVKLGELVEFCRLVPILRRSARERGDLYAGSILRTGTLILYSLVSDEPDKAREDVVDALAKWSQQGFQLQHFWELLGKASCDLYVGDGRTALDRQVARWPVMERSLVLRAQYTRTEALHLRARSLLATAQRLVQSDPERRPLLRQAERDARALANQGTAWAAALSLLATAGLYASRGETARAIAVLDDAARKFDAAEMALYSAVARRRQGQLTGGDGGRDLVAQADEWMTGARIKEPGRMTALFAPGFPD